MSILSFFTSGGKPQVDTPAGVFAGKVVVFTGTLQSGNRKMQRSEAQRIVAEKGGDVIVGESGRIRNANLLVLGKQAGNRQQSQKMAAATDRNVETITAEEFFRMIAN